MSNATDLKSPLGDLGVAFGRLNDRFGNISIPTLLNSS
jgi:hypothetical protein